MVESMKVIKAIFVLSVFFTSAFADFTLTYKIDNRVTQTVYYSNSNNVLFSIKDNNKVIEKLLIKDDKKYIIFNEDGIQHIYEISDELSEPIKSDEKEKTTKYKIIEKKDNIKSNGFNAQKWRVRFGENNQTTDIVVSKDEKIVTAISNVVNALKRILPADKQEQANMFLLDNGYVILETNNLKLISYKEQNIDKNIFSIYKQMNNKDIKLLAKEVEKCFANVCCGQESSKTAELSDILNKNINSWNLTKEAKCKQYNDSNVSIKSAIYSNKERFITVEIATANVAIKCTLKCPNAWNLKCH